MNSHRSNPDSLQPLVFEDGTVLQVYPSLEDTFMPLPGSGAEPPTETQNNINQNHMTTTDTTTTIEQLRNSKKLQEFPALTERLVQFVEACPSLHEICVSFSGEGGWCEIEDTEFDFREREPESEVNMLSIEGERRPTLEESDSELFLEFFTRHTKQNYFLHEGGGGDLVITLNPLEIKMYTYRLELTTCCDSWTTIDAS